MSITLDFDGSCWPNPGPMGVGYLATSPKAGVLFRVGAQIGPGTNNLAEYRALVFGLRHALRFGVRDIVVRTDSQLVANQVRGLFKVKNGALLKECTEVRQLLRLFDRYDVVWQPRVNNSAADGLSRELVWEEAPLPPPKPGKALHLWQAGYLKLLALKRPAHGLLARVFHLETEQVQAICQGVTYHGATLEGIPNWEEYEGQPETVACRRRFPLTPAPP
jgi:probable phosphoglycerate mutase